MAKAAKATHHRELLGDHDSRQRTSQTGETNLWRRWERKYAEHGAAQLLAVRKHLPDVLKVPPVSDHGQIGDITKLFGGADKLRGAVNELQTLLYAA
jgi:hypothetical protein